MSVLSSVECNSFLGKTGGKMILKKLFWALFFFSGALLAHWIMNQLIGVPLIFIPIFHIPMFIFSLVLSIVSKDD